MQIVTSGENLHEISTRFLGKVRKKNDMSSVEKHSHRMLSVKAMAVTSTL